MKFLREVLERAQGAKFKDSDLAPEGKVQAGEEMLGELPDELKRFYVAMLVFNKEVEARCAELHEWAEKLLQESRNGDREVQTADRLKIQQHTLDHQRMDLFRRCFWHQVREAFPKQIIRDDNLALRKGWQVVTYSDRVSVVQGLQELANLLMEK